MKINCALLIAGLSLVPQIAEAKTDCNQLARDFVQKNFQSSWSEYSKLLFLSLLTQMTVEEGQKELRHTGEVSFGPLKIGPGSWNEGQKNSLRTELQKYLSIEAVTQSAASVTSSSGDPKAVDAVVACIQANIVENGGLSATLKDKGTDTAVFEVMWGSAPREDARKVTIRDVTVDPEHGRITGGSVKKGRVLHDRLSQNAQIKRDPKKDLLVTLNLEGKGGSVDAYLPPSVLPPPPNFAKVPIQGNATGVIGSGRHFDGDQNPGCTTHAKATMHLTNNGSRSHSCAVASDFSEAAGAPAEEIEITPEMIDAGLAALYGFPITEPFESEMREAVVAVYRAMRSIRRPLRKSLYED